MKNYLLTLVFFASIVFSGFSQEISYFPKKNADWQEKMPNELNVNSKLLFSWSCSLFILWTKFLFLKFRIVF